MLGAVVFVAAVGDSLGLGIRVLGLRVQGLRKRRRW